MSPSSIFHNALTVEFGGSIQSMLKSDRAGRFIMQLSDDGFDIHKNLECVNPIYNQEKAGLSSYRELERGLLYALKELAKDPHTLDFVVDYCHRIKMLKSWSWMGCPLEIAARCPVRKADGTLRTAEEMGLKTGGEKLIRILLKHAIEHKDVESLRHLRTFPVGKKLITDKFLDFTIRELSKVKGNESLTSYFDEFILKEISSDMSLSRYWEILDRDDVFMSDTCEAKIREYFYPYLVRKLPDDFIERLMGFEKIFKSTVDKFILLMIEDGIDCYQGFLRGHGGAFFQFDHGHKPKNYQWLLDVCLKNLKLPGYEAMLNSIPLDEILKYKKPDMVLDLIHQMTGRKDVVAMMSHAAKGKALQRDLGM